MDGCYRAVASPIHSHKKLAIEPPLPGRFQIRNALTAATAARLLAERGFPIDDERSNGGIRAVRWPGRLERLSERPAFILTARTIRRARGNC